MFSALLIVAACQIPVDLHVNGTLESRLLLRAVTCDLPCPDEDARLVRHLQDELRGIVRIHDSFDTFVQIGRHKERLPLTALDNPTWTVLAIQREIRLWNSAKRIHEPIATAEDVKFAGIVDLGDEGQPLDLPQPWQAGFELTAWEPPRIEK